MSITFSENHESSLVAFESGESLASLRDPRGEGLKWVYSLGAIPTSHVVVVGLGSGFHIAALADVDPSLKISVVESRESLIPVFRSQFPELQDRVEIVIIQDVQDIYKGEFFQEILNNRSYVLSFKECWGQNVQFFSEVFAGLTGRSVESVKYHFEEFSINMKALYLEQNKLLSIKDVIPVVEASVMPENKKQIFRILGELVK
ncbi:hypothetical protein AZI87_09695 [Bdellovibrio bacteriovorus]|uniref:Spermidine synthase n=1 Tax=Bdellovibrio bacteriovorus TaxID=959 RepID=A0A161PG20_BDEBC|nr:hypothetical protein [Bdellovibrio bacteriovorus]KYG69444.1 hypothetical protein AZI87_09695 [Bdellovibrio bacteriovorus]